MNTIYIYIYTYILNTMYIYKYNIYICGTNVYKIPLDGYFGSLGIFLYVSKDIH